MIRELKSTELHIVQELAYRIWPSTFASILSPVQIDYMLAWMYDLKTLEQQQREGHRFFCYENNSGTPIGFLAVAPSEDTHRLKVHKLYVLPEYHSQGIGKLLLEKAFSYAKTLKLSHVYLNVNRYNKAVSFYQKMGMQIIKEEDIAIGNSFYMEDYVFEKEV